MTTARMKTFTICYNSDLSGDVILISKVHKTLCIPGEELRKMMYELILTNEMDIRRFFERKSGEVTNEDGDKISITLTTDFTGVATFSLVEEDIEIHVSAQELKSFFVERMRDEMVTLLENAAENDIVDYYRLKEKKLYTLPSFKTEENREE